MTDPPGRGDLRFRTIPRLVEIAADRFGEATALEDPDAGVRLSFVDLKDKVDRTARGFMAAGVEPGHRVAIWMPNTWEWVVAALGALTAGAQIVSINTRFRVPEATFVLARSQARHLCTTTDFLGRDYLSELTSGADDLQRLPHLRAVTVLRGPVPPGHDDLTGLWSRGTAVPPSALEARRAAVQPEDVSDILFTSGTTGRPKGVQTTHSQNLRAFLSWADLVGLRSGDRYLVVNPFFHSFGYKAGVLACLMAGATIIPLAVFDAGELLSRIERDRISVLPGPPTLYQSMLAHPDLRRHDTTSVRLAVTGAAPTPVALVVAMREVLGFETVITGYGLTETCGVAALCRHDDDEETIANTSGRALDDTEIAIFDEDGEALPAGAQGEVVVRGYNVMKGYLDEPEETAATIDPEGWLHTGDIGFLDERGYLHPTDRKKDVFIVGGFNAYPAEIESALLGYPGVAQVAVVGMPDDRLGEVGCAFVVPKEGAHVDGKAMIAWARERMANYKAPRDVRVVPELPMNASGKVLKHKLRESWPPSSQGDG